MELDQFLSREAFDALSSEEKGEYVLAVADAFLARTWSRQVTPADTLEYLSRCVEVFRWALTPEQYEETIGTLFWQVKLSGAERLASALEDLLREVPDDLPGLRRDELVEEIERLRWIAEHKRDLGELD